MSSALNHPQKEKKRKREFGQKEKTMKRIRCCVIGVFGSPRMHLFVKNEKRVSVRIRREWWWKSGRQGEKSGRKRGGKEGKGKKWFWEKSFLFLFDCACVFPFFPCTHHTTTPQHTLTLTHHPPYNTTHWCTPSHANRAVCCAAFFGSGQRDTHCIIHTPHSITWHHPTHTNQPNTQTAHGANNNEKTIGNEKEIGQRGKSGTTQQHKHTDWSGNNTMALKHTGLWLTIERWVDVADI